MPNSFLLGPPSTITRWFSIFDNTVYICLKQLLCRTTKHVGRPEGVSHKVSFYDQDPWRSTKLEIYVMITYQMVSSPVFDIWGKLAFHWFQTLWLPTWPPPQPPPRPPWHHDFHLDHHLDGQVRAGVDCPRRVRLARLSFHARVQGPSNLRAVSVIFPFRNWSFNCAFADRLTLCMLFPFAMSMLHVLIFYSSRLVPTSCDHYYQHILAKTCYVIQR